MYLLICANKTEVVMVCLHDGYVVYDGGSVDCRCEDE